MDSPGITVVGAGVPRTGTYTLRTALNTLGIRTYHKLDLVRRGDWSKWASVRKGNPASRVSSSIWDRIFSDAGFSACVDFPSSLYWSEIKQYFESKHGRKVVVILTERDSAEQWYDSMQETVIRSHSAAQSWTHRILRLMPGRLDSTDPMIAEGCFEGRLLERDYCERVYQAHNDFVKSMVEESELLVLNVAKHGYRDLIQFLEKHQIPLTNADELRDLSTFEVSNSRSHYLGQPFIRAVRVARVLLIAASLAAVAGLAYSGLVPNPFQQRKGSK